MTYLYPQLLGNLLSVVIRHRLKTDITSKNLLKDYPILLIKITYKFYINWCEYYENTKKEHKYRSWN